MEKTLLNNYTMNEAIAILKEAIQKKERSHFKLQCDNCTISIVAENPFGNNRETIEVALRSVDDSDWIYFESNKAIIRGLPLIAFPAFAKQFKALAPEDFAEVWDAWDTISCYM